MYESYYDYTKDYVNICDYLAVFQDWQTSFLLEVHSGPELSKIPLRDPSPCR